MISKYTPIWRILDLSFVFTKIEESDIDSKEYAEFK